MNGPKRSQCRIDPFDPFEVMLNQPHTCKPVVVRSAQDANGATLAFHEEWQRLRQDQAAGDLLLVQYAEEPRTLFWEPLG